MLSIFFFFFNDTATTEIYTLSLHDALPISATAATRRQIPAQRCRHAPGRVPPVACPGRPRPAGPARSEEHTSELQSRLHLVCRLLLEKKKKKTSRHVVQSRPVCATGSCTRR